MNELPKTAAEARSIGKKLFYTGKPCGRGHIAPRQASGGSCTACVREYRQSEKGRATSAAYYQSNTERFAKLNRDTLERRRTERPWISAIRSSRARAESRGIEFTITAAWGRAVWTGVCAITGIAFATDRSGSSGPKPFSATLDRIDQTKGYTPDNARFVLHCVNVFRGLMGDEEMLRVAKAICDANR
jgi:hypothetical protein